MHDFNEDLTPTPPPPEGFEEDEQFEFELGNIMVMAGDGSPMSVPAIAWVMDHLPKYKAAGPLGDRYEHFLHMPREYVREIVFNALNGNLPESMVKIWRSG